MWQTPFSRSWLRPFRSLLASALLITDSFNRSAGPLADDDRWEHVYGSGGDQWEVISGNEARGFGESQARLSVSMSDNHYARDDNVQANTAGNLRTTLGVRCKDGRGYAWQPGAGVHRQNVAGSSHTTFIISHSSSVGDDVQLEAEGSTIRLRINGVVEASTTHTSYTDGRPGLQCRNNSPEVQRYEGGEL